MFVVICVSVVLRVFIISFVAICVSVVLRVSPTLDSAPRYGLCWRLMRKILLVFTPLFFFFLTAIFSSPVQAQTLSVTPTSGTTADTFRASGYGYESRREYFIRGLLGGNFFGPWRVMTNDAGSFTETTIGPFSQEGSWEIKVDAGYSDFVGNTVNLTIRGSAPLTCGSRCDPPPTSDRCPGSCPCALSGSVWRCGGSVIPPVTPIPSGFQVQRCSGGGVNTGIGCIPTTAAGFASFFLGYLLGIAGVVAFFLILVAGFQILTSAGNPEKLEGAKQLLTAAVIGLFFIILSVLLLQIIGYQILDLRGFVKFER